MEFKYENPYISCGNGCNAHFQNEDEQVLQNMTFGHSQKCSETTLFKDDPNAFYFVEPPITPIRPYADWTNFNLKFLSNKAYDATSRTTTDFISVTRMEALAIARSENFPLVKFFWDEIVAGLTIPPHESAIEEWNAIASENFMPFEFDKSGKMVLL